LVLGETRFDDDVLALNKAFVVQSPPERGHEVRQWAGGGEIEEPDNRHRRLLRARRQRPSRRRSA
jgi:hypothetical protein